MSAIFTKEEIAAAEANGTLAPNLPPAGDARREVLAARTDQLEEKAEEIYKDRGAIPESALQPDREIQNDIHKGILDIGSGHPFLRFVWVNYVNQHGSKPWEYKAKGWKVATAEDVPEAKELIREDGTIRVGDTMLFCIRADKHLEILRKNEQNQAMQQLGIEAPLHDILHKHRDKFKLRTDLGDDQRSTANAGSASRNAAARTAINHLGNKMKEGPVPGLPLK